MKKFKHILKTTGAFIVVAAPIVIVGTVLSAPVLPLVAVAAFGGGLASGFVGYKMRAAADKKAAESAPKSPISTAEKTSLSEKSATPTFNNAVESKNTPVKESAPVPKSEDKPKI